MMACQVETTCQLSSLISVQAEQVERAPLAFCMESCMASAALGFRKSPIPKP